MNFEDSPVPFLVTKKKTSKLNMEPAKFHDVLKATLLLDIAPVRFHGKFFGEST